MSQDGLFLLSPYNCSFERAMEDSKAVDLTDLVAAFSTTVWFLAFTTFILLSNLVAFHFKSNGVTNNHSAWTVVTYLLLNPTFTIRNWASKFIALLIALFSLLFVVLLLNNAIKTDQLTMREQKVYRTFHEIIDDMKSGSGPKLLYPSGWENMKLTVSPSQMKSLKSLQYYMKHQGGHSPRSVFDVFQPMSQDSVVCS